MIDPRENHIMVNPIDRIPCTGETWQAIGYYKGQHIAAHGTSPLDALTKALATQEELCEDEGCPQHGTPHICTTQEEDAFS